MATILDNIKNVFTPKPVEEKQVGNMVGYFGVGSSKSKQYTYADLAEEGYMKNSIVYRCVNEIAKGASAVPFMVKAGDQVLDSHPIVTLMSRPNPLQSHSEFFNSIFGFLLLSGNAYILRVGSEVGAPKELHLLRPDRMVIKGGSNPIPDRYEYVINGRVQAVYDVEERTGFSEVKHVKLWNPLDDFYGLSPMSAAAIEVDQHNMSGKHNINLLSNGARPSGAVVFKPQDDAGISVNLTESQRQQLLTDLNNRFSGTANAGRPLLLEGDFDWKEMGLSPKDMDFLNLKHMAATDIAMCFGVPSQLVGVPDAQTYANVAEARLALYEETIIPHLKKLESDFNEWLVPMFGENLEFCFDIDKIPALAERTKRTYENVTSAVREGIMTRNEAREAIGLSPIDGADDLYISATLFPITSDEGGEQPDDPVAEEELDAYVEDEDMDLDFLEEDEKALSDIDTMPTDGMATEAQRGLNWRQEHNRGGTAVGVARANQLVSKERLSISTVKRMFSFFSRHEVDKQGQGFDQGEDGYPSAGRIAWALWGGDAGFAWSRRKVEQIKREEEKFLALDNHIEVKLTESKAVSGAVKKGLQKKVDDHNEEYGDTTTKRTNLRTLTAVFERGVGAYRTNPSSVRPSVNSEEQWAYARVNSYLYALRNGRFRSGKHDTDLFPKGHPLSSK
tara:strand:- start:2388 stop:4415 length:2028 start_codon:yes stop_codon:yes gene_type:complete